MSFPRSQFQHRIKWPKTWFANGYVFRCVWKTKDEGIDRQEEERLEEGAVKPESRARAAEGGRRSKTATSDCSVVADRPASTPRLIAARRAIVRARISLPVLTHGANYSNTPGMTYLRGCRITCNITDSIRFRVLGTDLTLSWIEIESTATRVGDTWPNIKPRGYYPSGERPAVRHSTSEFVYLT